MSKRLKFVLSSALLSLGFISIQFLDEAFKIPSIFILTVMSGLFSAWSFKESLGKNMVWLSLVLPVLFTLGSGLFWFLLPSSIFTMIPIFIFYTIGIYVLLTTMNIYTVSTQKTIALFRAAKGVGFVMTLVVAFLVYDAILSLRSNILVSGIYVFITSLLIFWQGFWSIELDKEFDKKVFAMTTISSLIIFQISIIMFFWPVTVVVGSLFLTSGVYLLLGLGQSKLEDRLFPGVIREYLTVGIIVLLGMLMATRWGGE